MKIAQILTFAAVSSAAYVASAQNVTLGFDNNRGDYGAFETTGTDTALTIFGPSASTDFSSMSGLSSGTYTISGAPLTSAFSFTVTSSPSTLTLDTTGLDVASGGIDSGETITFIFSTDIILKEFDFSTIGTSETASVTVAGSTTNYDGSATNDAQTVNFSLSAGQALVFSNGGSNPIDYDLQSISFTVVPEPGTYALLSGLSALAFIMLRRRSLK
jgi:hypothetical protein